jgi:hypothetical protein
MSKFGGGIPGLKPEHVSTSRCQQVNTRVFRGDVDLVTAGLKLLSDQ